ncbi:MAG: four helix bundle protein [Fulvivirga sp.]|uniref:four helix bundle protein n=1 Tax=Fulvivirga sp. TaxID=1931237 RepID=UPI0032EA988D
MLSEPLNEIKSFEDLECWKHCKELRSFTKPIISKFPKEEKFRLYDQIIRAVRSTTNNIAEGYGRFHYQENIQFCRVSRGSLFELIDHFIIAEEENYISNETLLEIKLKINRCLAILNGYINYLRKAKTVNN